MKFILPQKALTFKVRAFYIFTFLFFMSCQSPSLKPQAIELTAISSDEPLRNLQSDILPLQKVIVSFLGDVIIHERLRHREESSHEGFQAIWFAIQKYIDQVDMSYANLEGPVAPELGGVSGFPRFNFPEEIISSLKKNGFDIISTANNHALDRNALGIKKTIQNLNKYHLAYTGTISSEADIQNKKETWWGLTAIKGTNLKLAWIACTEMTNGNVDKENQILFCFKNQEKIKNLIQALKTKANIAGIILTPHWGQEDKFTIEAERSTWAHSMINEGALAVVGSHPHVLQKIENYKAADGRNSFIAYSMGNFISNQPWTPNKTSMMLFSKMEINRDQKLEIIDLKYIALWMARTIDKDHTSKFRIYPIWDLLNAPPEAISIWQGQLSEERRLKTAIEAAEFLTP